MILLEEIGRLLQTSFYSDDTELQGLYAQYGRQRRSYEEIREEGEQDMQTMTAQMMNDMFDMDIDAKDPTTRKKVREKISAKQAEFEAAELKPVRKTRSKRQNRKPAGR